VRLAISDRWQYKYGEHLGLGISSRVANRGTPLALLLLVVHVGIGTGCGKYRDHVYASRLVGHFVAYQKEYRKQPKSSDTLDLTENGSCVHSYITAAGTKEESCTWIVVEKVDGTWVRFEGLSNGIHRLCSGNCVIEAAATDGDVVTEVEFPSAPDFFYVK
jgi:hypothetical protein